MFRDGLSFFTKSTSLIRQSNLLKHLVSTRNYPKRQGYGSPEGPLTILVFLVFVFYFSIFLVFHFIKFGFLYDCMIVREPINIGLGSSC